VGPSSARRYGARTCWGGGAGCPGRGGLRIGGSGGWLPLPRQSGCPGRCGGVTRAILPHAGALSSLPRQRPVRLPRWQVRRVLLAQQTPHRRRTSAASWPTSASRSQAISRGTGRGCGPARKARRLSVFGRWRGCDPRFATGKPDNENSTASSQRSIADSPRSGPARAESAVMADAPDGCPARRPTGG